jgi:hypothetical protein
LWFSFRVLAVAWRVLVCGVRVSAFCVWLAAAVLGGLVTVARAAGAVAATCCRGLLWLVRLGGRWLSWLARLLGLLWPLVRRSHVGSGLRVAAAVGALLLWVVWRWAEVAAVSARGGRVWGGEALAVQALALVWCALEAGYDVEVGMIGAGASQWQWASMLVAMAAAVAAVAIWSVGSRQR